MSFLLDTCIISKMRKLKTRPDSQLLDWINKHPETSYYISVLTIGEIQAGIAKLDIAQTDQQRQRMMLEDWLFGELTARFHRRILDVTLPIVFTWGKLSGESRQNGDNIPAVDGLLAATAIHHGLIMVTDNVKHFKNMGVEIINPWQSAAKRPG